MDVDTKKRAADEALEASVSKRSREDVAAAAEVQPAPTTVSAVVAKAIVNEQPCTMVDVEVGISSYLTSELPGFGGILKQSCEDFLVNEIGTDGQVVRLTTTELPQEDCAKVVEEPQGDDDALKELKSILGDTHVQGVATLAQDPSLDAKFSAPGPNDKAARGNIHRLIRQLFPGVDSTSETDSATGICTMKFSRLSKTSKRGKKLKPAKKFLEFVAHKHNKDTNEVTDVVSHFLHIKPNRMSISGNKDRRAVTAQKMTCRLVTGKQLAALNSRLYGIKLGNFRYCDEQLKLGDLNGNRFEIVLREVTGDDELLNRSMESLSKNGFINYFGRQRFGTHGTPTHHVGKALLSEQWEKAIDMVAGVSPTSFGAEAQARKTWATTKDPKKAMQMFPGRCRVEKSLMRGVIHHGIGYQAFVSIPRNMRMLYLHAYQSYLWNVVTTKRLELHGLKPVVGDLVLDSDSETFHPDDEKKIGVRILTEADLPKYTIHDIVLPMPGYSVMYPTNDVGGVYEQVIKDEGVNFADQTEKDLRLSGAYRHIVALPEDVQWSIKRYNDHRVPLVHTDVDRLEGRTAEVASVEDGKYKALVLAFSLKQSTYATMALREVMKSRTDQAYHTQLGKASIKRFHESKSDEAAATAPMETETSAPMKTETV